ncbi:oligosaccharide repeat unit polymerase [Paenisporosarcina sp. NPDC076898]|uniref:oligosaccharide repeat unit polymerase n=1 Tax=unclassified Paenisporosarcina TaxID=2642018 RepID=UPI003D02A3DC
MLIFSIWLITVVASTFLFQKASGSLSPLKPNMISIVYYYSFFISSYIGGLLIALGIDKYYMINRMDHEEFRLIGFLLLTLMMLLFPAIQLLVNRVFQFNSQKELNHYLILPVRISRDKNKIFFTIVFFIFSMISVLAVAYTLIKTGTVPLFELLKGNTSDLALLRIEAARNFNGNVLIRNIFGIALTPLLSIVAYLYAATTKDLLWKTNFYMLFISSVLISTYDLAKSPIFFYVMMLILARFYAHKLVLNARRIAGYGIVAALLLIMMYVSIQGVTGISSYLQYSSGPVGRIILAQIAPFFLHLDVFSFSMDHLGIRSLPSFVVNLFDVEQVRSARIVMENIFPENVDKGTAGVLNTVFLGEAFASAGYLGVLIAIIYVAIVVQILYVAFLRLPKTPAVIALFIYFTINIPRTLVGGVSDFLFNPIWLMITLLLAGFLFLEQYFAGTYSFILRKLGFDKEKL